MWQLTKLHSCVLNLWFFVHIVLWFFVHIVLFSVIFTLLSLNSSCVAANYKWHLVIKSNNLYETAQLNRVKQILFRIYKDRK